MSNETQLSPVRVVLEISSGVIVQASSDSPVDLVVLDHDVNDGAMVSIDGIETSFYRINVELDDDTVQVVYREVEAMENSGDEDSD